MSSLSNIQGALLDSIIKQTQDLMSALEENRIFDAEKLYSLRNKNLSILSDIKTNDLSKLKNYPAFIVSLHNFNAKFAAA